MFFNSTNPNINGSFVTKVDVTMAAGAQTVIYGSLSNVSGVFVSNLAGNPNAIRVGDLFTAANRGTELLPGQTIYIPTRGNIAGWNPGGAALNVGVTWVLGN